MRVLCVTRIFPSRADPVAGPYNKKQLAALAQLGHEVTVINPVPTFPGVGWFGKQGHRKSTSNPRSEEIAGLQVLHPRYLHIPKLPAVAAPLYAAGTFADVAKLRSRFDVILSPFAYPDGIASVMLGRVLKLPVVVKLHGGDMNVAARMAQVGPWVKWGFPKAQRIAAVSYPLAAAAHDFGVPWSKIAVVEDGVDSALFHLRDRRKSKLELGLPEDRKHIVYVGRLEQRKGIYELMESFESLAARVANVDLVLVGDGDDGAAVRSWAQKMGPRVVLTGMKAPDQVAPYYSAADLTTLPSHAEGTPNCVIEALACGCPVVATSVGGVPDMIHNERMGALVPVRDVPALTAAFERCLTTTYEPAEVARLTGRGTWSDSARCLADVLLGATRS